MKRFTWFTHTNIDTRFSPKQELYSINDTPKITWDLSEFLQVFKKNQIWNKSKYRTAYRAQYNEDDISKISAIKIHLHSEGAPYSNLHNYEKVLTEYIDLDTIEHSKISSSGISEASQIAVIQVEFDSENKVIDYLNYEEEKNVTTVFEKGLSSDNHDSWLELIRLKSVVCEFVQFFNYNLHLNFLTNDYEFSITDNPNLTGFTTVTDGVNYYYETDKIDFFAHYVLYQKDKDIVLDLMRVTSKFWHKDIPSIHFFLDALKGSHITSTNFIKLVFCVESFFGRNVGNDFITLTIPLIIGKNINDVRSIREVLRASFVHRNDLVHGNEIYDLAKLTSSKYGKKSIGKLFFELKNILISIFYFFLNEKLYEQNSIEKIDHELMFRLIPLELRKSQSKKYTFQLSN